jgi:hypothetical protein
MPTTPTIPAGNLYMNATTYSGSNSSQSITNGAAGASFQPDFAWIKSRNTADGHDLIDSVRGTSKNLYSNSTAAEDTVARLTSFDANGITLAGGYGYTNASGQNFVAWQWKAGGTAVSNTTGTITSSVSANQTSGFSVVTYTGTGSNGSVGHGLSVLGVAPAMVIVKARGTVSGGGDWCVWHSSLTSGAYALFLNTTNAQSSFPTVWNSTIPTSSVFSIGTAGSTNNSTTNFVAYCWAPIAGYSAFGSYTGNGSADGSFVYLGFRPRFIMIKKTSAAQDWYLYDTARDTYNAASKTLFPNGSYAEESTRPIDILSNGFKLRTSTSVNDSGATYIYAAFAENPFKYANAR